MNWQVLQPYLVALAIGLLLGFERERSHRRTLPAGSRSFALLALLGAVAATFGPWAVIAGACLFGLSVGTVVMLPAIWAQREFAPARYGAVVNRVWTVGQTLFAFGPMGAGALLAWSGSPLPTISACMVAQLAAVALCVGGRGRRG